MTSQISLIRNKTLAWAAVFALVLSTIPYSSADHDDDETYEWFEDWDYELVDRDGNDDPDLIVVEFDPNTNSTEEIEVHVSFSVYNDDYDYIGGDDDSYDIVGNQSEYFELEWSLEDCYYGDDDCQNGPYTFEFGLYDDNWNLEDNFSISNVDLYERGMPDGVVQVDGGSFSWEEDGDGLHNDAVARAAVEYYFVENVTYELERYVQGVWVDAGNATTDEEGIAVIFNRTDGEYRWFAYYENEEIDKGWFVIEANANQNIGSMAGVDDTDEADDYDDFIFALPPDNDDDYDDDCHNYEVYAEVYYEGNDTLYTSGSGDCELILPDVPEGNYTFEMYSEEDGDLLQTGWMHSYGSDSDYLDYWFASYNYTTEDSNGDGVINNLTITYDPDTTSQDEEDVYVEIQLHNSSNFEGYEYEYQITGNETDEFGTDVITVEKSGNYSVTVVLFDDNWYDRDEFFFELYLACDETYTECDHDEWFEDWSSETEDTDGDNLDDTIKFEVNPDTECDCEIDMNVIIEVYHSYEDDEEEWVDTDEYEVTINGNEIDELEFEWTSHENDDYNFYVTLVDDDWNWEDSFSIYNQTLYATSGGGGPGDEDEWFEDFDEEIYDGDYDGNNDTIEWYYNPDTSCDCNITIDVYFNVTDADDGSLVDYFETNHTIYNDDSETYWAYWSPDYNGTFDFEVEMYDEDGNFEDSFESSNVALNVREENEDEDYDEWFATYDWDYESSDTVEIGFDPNTECDCDVYVYVESEVYDGDGDYVTSMSDDGYIYGTDSDWWTEYFTADYTDYYDFEFRLYDSNGNFEDNFSLYDIYLEGNGSGSGGDSDDIGHIGAITEWHGDGYVNDYVGEVSYDLENKEDSYYEIYDQNGNLIDSGHPNTEFGVFMSANLSEGVYYGVVYYEESDDLLQMSPFYSYGNSSGNTSNVINVEMGVMEDEVEEGEPNLFCEDGPCDDAFFRAHIGDFDNGVAGVEIEICKYDDTEECEYYDTINTNSSGDAISYDGDCGVYEWNATYMGDEIDGGAYRILAHCDNNGGGGSGDSDEWFEDRDFYVESSNTIHIEYDPNTDCYCDVRVWVYIDVYQNGSKIDTIADDYYIYQDDFDWFEQDWTASDNGSYDFKVVLFDGENGPDNYEDEFWIYDVYLSENNSDEEHNIWIYYAYVDAQWIDSSNDTIWDEGYAYVSINTDCGCDVDVHVVLEVYDQNDNVVFAEDQERTIDGWQSFDFSDIYFEEAGHHTFVFTLNEVMEDGTYRYVSSYDISRMILDVGTDYNIDIIGNNVNLTLDPYSNYEGEFTSYFYISLCSVENVEEYCDGIFYDWDSFMRNLSGSNMDEITKNWTLDGGHYRLEISVSGDWSSSGNIEYFTIVSNQAPDVDAVNINGVLANNAMLYEGQELLIRVDASDVDGDDLTYTWDMGDGGPNETSNSNTFDYRYLDDGKYDFTVSVSDGVNTWTETFKLDVKNKAPALIFPQITNVTDEGKSLGFTVEPEDVMADEVKVTWTFEAGITLEGNFVQYTFKDDGIYQVVVTAKDDDGGETVEVIIVTVNNVAPIFEEFMLPTSAEEGQLLDFRVSASDPGDDTITYTFDFGDGTAQLLTQDGNVSHKFADGDTFTIVICALDEDGGETCRTEELPVSLLEQLEESGLPGFGLVSVISALGVIGILRRRTH